MPITKSAKKALRQTLRRTKDNSLLKAKLKKAIKTAKPSNVAEVSSIIDKAAKKKIIHPNRASRLKSRLAKKFGGPAPKPAPHSQLKRRPAKLRRKSS